LYEAVESGESIGPQRGCTVLFGAVRVVELVAEVGKVGEGELAWVGAVADAEEAEFAGDEVAVGFVLAEGAFEGDQGKGSVRTDMCSCRSRCWPGAPSCGLAGAGQACTCS